MFACHCTEPWRPLITCVQMHGPKKMTHTVALLRQEPHRMRTMSSEDKAAVWEANLCKNCNGKRGTNHICTRHPSEEVEHPTPYS